MDVKLCLDGREDRLREFENEVPRRIFLPKREEDTGENYITMSFSTFALQRLLLGG
jgi:hypothetical protein